MDPKDASRRCEGGGGFLAFVYEVSKSGKCSFCERAVEDTLHDCTNHYFVNCIRGAYSTVEKKSVSEDIQAHVMGKK